MDKFLSIIESKNFDSNAESDFFDEQTFQTYMHKIPIWDFLKVDRLEFLAMSKDQKIAAIKKYAHPMKNLDTGLNADFIRDGKFLFTFCSCLTLSCWYVWNF